MPSYFNNLAITVNLNSSHLFLFFLIFKSGVVRASNYVCSWMEGGAIYKFERCQFREALKDSFQTSPNPTLTSSPSNTDCPRIQRNNDEVRFVLDQHS